MNKKYYLDNFIFCPICKSELNRQKDSVSCISCGFIYYDNPKPVVTAIIENKKGEIIAVKRKVDPFKGYLDLPGGFMKVEETIDKAIKREIHEELGVNFELEKYIGNYYCKYEFNKVFYKLIVFVVSGIVDDFGAIKSGDDISGFEFLSKKIIFKSEFSFPEVNIKALKEYLKI